MNRISIAWKRLFVGVLTVLMLFSASPVHAETHTVGERTYTEDDIESFEAVIPVFIDDVAGSGAQIEFLEGPQEILPEQTELTPDESGNGSFRMSFLGAVEGDVFKYRITEVPGTDIKTTYNVENKTYICEVWIFYNEGIGDTYARAFLYESEEPIDLNDEANDSIPKPDKCTFTNVTHTNPPTPHSAETWGGRGEDQASGERNPGLRPPNGVISFTPGDGKLIKLSMRGNNGPYTVFTDSMDSITIPAYDENGNQIGRYVMTKAERDNVLAGKPGRIQFLLDDETFVGDPQPCEVQVEDEYGYVMSAYYQPHVVTPPGAEGDETSGWKGETQTGTITFTEGSGRITNVELIDPSIGTLSTQSASVVYTVDALDKSGAASGNFKLDLSTKNVNADGTISYAVVFTPNAEFVGTPLPATIRGTDENGFTAEAIYQPHVKDKGETPTKPPTSTPTSAKTGKTTTTPKTGDDFRALPYIIGIAAAFAVLLLIIGKRRKRRREDE